MNKVITFDKENPLPLNNDLIFDFKNKKSMKWTEKIKSNSEIRKAFDKGVTAGIVFAMLVGGLIWILIKMIKLCL